MGPYWSVRPSKSPVTRTTPDSPFSMVKYTEGAMVWSDGPRNKYDPGKTKEGHFSSKGRLVRLALGYQSSADAISN